ncbi:hypothetical protein EAO79_17995 [Plantibacter sp. PA-3-X8]|nr:hypothetical protein EAO79_17995 [Plantibacter sp. PA-3-X8]
MFEGSFAVDDDLRHRQYRHLGTGVGRGALRAASNVPLTESINRTLCTRARDTARFMLNGTREVLEAPQDELAMPIRQSVRCATTFWSYGVDIDPRLHGGPDDFSTDKILGSGLSARPPLHG